MSNGKEAAPESSIGKRSCRFIMVLKYKNLGSLTSLDRDSWAEARVELENAGNGEYLKKIDGGLFAICLDDLKTEEHKR